MNPPPPPTPSAGVAVPRSWQIALPFREPLSTNDVYGRHWGTVTRLTRPWKDTAIHLARRATRLDGPTAGQRERIPLLARMTVVLHYAPQKKRGEQIDLDNLHACLKPLVDGLKKAGVVADDNAKHYTPTAPVVHAATGEPGRLWLVVIDLAGPDETPAGGPAGGKRKREREDTPRV